MLKQVLKLKQELKWPMQHWGCAKMMQQSGACVDVPPTPTPVT